MSDPFVAEIRIFPFNFPPKGWAWCDGQLMSISQNTALFSLLGTTYGGDGRVTFGLPDLQGRAPMHPGQGPGLSLHDLGEMSGVESVALLTSEMPVHSHAAGAQTSPLSSVASPTNATLGRPASGFLYAAAQSLVQMDSNTLQPAGGSFPHNNMQPYLTFNFNIALQGIFPPRS